MAGDRWPTPSANEPGWAHIEVVDKNGNAPEHFNQRLYDKKTGRLVQKGLPQAVKLWPTPVFSQGGARAEDLIEGNSVRRRRSGQRRGIDLQTAAKFWPTPPQDAANNRKKKYAQGGTSLSLAIGEGSLNPAWVCAHLMNWPAGWDSLEPLPPNSIKEWKEKTLAGTWWLEEPDIPRIGKNIPDRAKRLKVLGNGMVPLCFAVAFEELSR